MSKNDHSNRATTEVHNITEKELEPSSAYDKLRTRAMEILQKGGIGDPLRSDGDFGQWFWREAIAVLIDKYKWSLPSERLLVDL